jgi:putative membrane-bound dehydrogenase-like protein
MIHRMRRFFVAIVLIVAFTSSVSLAQTKKKLFLLTQSGDFDHDVVKPKDGKPSVVQRTFQELAGRTGMFELEHSRDARVLAPEKLKTVDIVVFYTTGTPGKQLPMNAQDLTDWVNAGGKFLGLHSATDTFHGVPAYTKMINGEFQAHPWNQDTTVTIKILDPAHAAAKPWVDAVAKDANALTFKEEIYQLKNFDPADVHVILGLDMEKTELKKPQFIPIAYCKEQGKGRVFYTSLGHRQSVWENPVYQDHVIAALKWLTGEAQGDAKPNVDVSKAEDELAKKVAPPEKPKEPKESEKKKDGTPMPAASAEPAAGEVKLPKVADGFAISVFARAPDIKSPASIAVAPDGVRRLFVGEDEYNTQPKRDPGLSRVKLCADTDNDGKADRFTVFADKINSPQGMTFVGGTLYVVHAPLLTAFRDTNDDGVADERVDLVTGLGPVPEGLVHHVPSGVHMGIDGWLYISIGDKGIAEATGKDGRKITLWGGGVVRVRPDGTMLEVFSSRTRNTYDVAIDPLLGTFTRDNTNDGNGWDSRIAQMQRGGEYGYPSLFKNWTDETVDPVASYGSGSATGSTFVHEPGLPGRTGDSLYTCDWARGVLYRHDMKRVGARFEATQEEFIKDIRPTDVEVDGRSRLFVSDWGRRDWGNAPAVGTIYIVASAAAPKEPFPDLSKSSDDELLAGLASPSHVLRLECQQGILRRAAANPATQGKFTSSLRSAAMRRGELDARVAALFTLKQLDGENSNPMLATLCQSPELREFALRALADRDDQHYGVNENLFVASLKDPNPRVREQAAIGIGYLGKAGLAASLVASTTDTDAMVRHAAVQSLRRLGNPGRDACIASLSDPNPQIVMGALRTLREFHDDATVSAVAALLQSPLAATPRVARPAATQPAPPTLREEIVKALAKLDHVPGKWDGKSWWTPHPDTRGPYYVHVPWPQSPRVADLLLGLAQDADPAVAKSALNYIGLLEMKEAPPQLSRMIAAGGATRDDAAKALIAIKSASPESLAALERVVLGDQFNADVRGEAAGALAGIDAAKSQPILLRLLVQLDRAPLTGDKKLPPGLIEKVADALAARPAPPETVTSVLPLLSATKTPIRLAAATALLRSSDPAVRAQVQSVWSSLPTGDPTRAEALLLAVPRVPKDNVAPYAKQIHDFLRDARPSVRSAATMVLGHLGDASAVKDLVQLASRDRDPLPAVSALAGIDPATTADDQVVVVATLLVENSAKVQKTDNDAYVRLVGAAQKFLNDPRIPQPKAISLRAKMMEPGIIYNFLRTDPIPLPPNVEEPLKKAFPPEGSAGASRVPFSVNGKEFSWKPITVNDPKGMYNFDMPADHVAYFLATFESPTACSAYLTCGSDDAIAVWLNGKRIHEKPIDRGMHADEDRVAAPLMAGKNVFLFKVYNRTGPAGVQARLHSRVVEFAANLDDLGRAIDRVPADHADAKKGRVLFEQTLGCAKCHTLNREEEPRGPFLGDVGGKFDRKYIIESVLKPSAKIAQGFHTEHVLTKPSPGSSASAAAGDYTGFVTKETATEIQMRDLTGRVTTVPKASITKRDTLPESMMPTGLADGLPLDDFASLVAFLTALK